MSERFRYVLALVVGLVAIPGLALATNGALSSDEPEESTEVLSVQVATSTSVDGSAISADDLVRACGVEGYYLVELEAVGATDDIQQAALNALRPICDGASLPLPAGPVVEGETIVETVTVVRAVPGPAAAASTTTSTTLEGTARAQHQEGDAAEALEVRERALAAIETAIAVGGKVEKINEAIALIDRGDAAYLAADYDTAEELFGEAEHKAIEAQHELEEHEDHDEYEEDDEYEDDEHDEYEDDEHDEHEDDD